MKKTKNILSSIYVALIFIFMYAPIVMLIIQSFNASKSRGRWAGFTTKWYVSLFSDEGILTAFRTTILLALLSAAIAVVLGTAASIAMAQMARRRRAIITGITNIRDVEAFPRTTGNADF